MAFVAAISDLFNCGKPRRPQARGTALETFNARDVTAPVPVPPTVRVGATTAHLRADTPPDRLPTPPSDDTTFAQFFPKQPATHNDRPGTNGGDHVLPPSSPVEANVRPNHDDVPDDVAEDPHDSHKHSVTPAKIDHKPWLVEQRIVVTSGTQVTNKVLSDSPQEAQLDAVAIIPTLDDEIEPGVKSSPQLDTESEGGLSLQVEDVAPAPASRLVAETKSRESEDSPPTAAIPVPKVADVAQQEAVAAVFPSKEVGRSIALEQKTAPKHLLDLPAEVRNAIYKRLVEASPIRMCRYDDPALASSENELIPPRRQYYNFTKICRQIREEFLPVYEQKTEYIIDLWAQRKHLAGLGTLKGRVALDIDAACFDMAPIDLLPLIRYLARTGRANIRFASTEGVVFRSIETIVEQLNKLLPSNANRQSWMVAVNGPMKRIDLHLFPHEDVRNFYRFRGAEPMLRIVYPSAATEGWMKQSHKSGGEYEAYLTKTGLDALDMHVVVGHASRRTTNADRLPLDWRLSYVGSRLSMEQAVRISGTFTR